VQLLSAKIFVSAGALPSRKATYQSPFAAVLFPTCPFADLTISDKLVLQGSQEHEFERFQVFKFGRDFVLV
jgi:hypothetical protein